ncbi:MAG TPA: peptidase T [Gaiellaceae bacterium]
MSLADELQADTLERFLRYVRVDTQSAYTDSRPSTERQLDLSRLLRDELDGLGLEEIELTEQGYVFATLPGSGPTVGLIAHVDVSPDAPGAGVQPQVHEGYQGGELVGGLSPETSPLLGQRLGHDIVTSDGTTLLGADDKAGVAEIMSAVSYLGAHPEIEHATVRVGFTTDEEIGHGTDHFDLGRFGADFAYTADGAEVGEVENETFSAIELKITFPGAFVHPGVAKGKLVNPIKLAAAFIEKLPKDTLSPETTEGKEGFVHPLSISGNAESCTVTVFLRDHDDDELAAHEALVRRLATEAHPDASFERWFQYRNMRAKLDEVPHVVEAALEATRRAGLEPRVASIRGGTDGSRLTEKGLPTPNLYTGGNEYHSVREWISVQDMAVSAATIVELVKLWSEPEWRDRQLSGSGSTSSQ